MSPRPARRISTPSPRHPRRRAANAPAHPSDRGPPTLRGPQFGPQGFRNDSQPACFKIDGRSMPASACAGVCARSRAGARRPRRSSASARAPDGCGRARPSRESHEGPALGPVERRSRAVPKDGIRISSGIESTVMPVLRRQDRHPLHRVPQLADVARPGVPLEDRQHLIVHGLRAGSCCVRRTPRGNTRPARARPPAARAARARGSARRSADRTDPAGTCPPR